MYTVEKQLDLDFHYPLNVMTDMNKIIFFDIETTGFSIHSTHIYLIGCVYYYESKWVLRQWFSNEIKDEPLMLFHFFEQLNRFQIAVSYNGEGFDIPYLESKCKQYALPYCFQNIKSLDIYREILPLRHILKLLNLKQKTVETFFNIQRTDLYDGKELIAIYHKYIHKQDSILLDRLLIHNSDDIICMIGIFPVLSYLDLFNENFNVEELDINDDTGSIGNQMEAIIHIRLNKPVPKRISYGFGAFYLVAYQDFAKLKIKMHTDELKYFYSNYKDYYYLPEEDRSIHKSVAFYVDKNYRTKAKAANCYSKKTGRFLPQYEELILPYFKINYNDKVSYFELSEDLLNNHDKVKEYAVHILSILKKHKKSKK